MEKTIESRIMVKNGEVSQLARIEFSIEVKHYIQNDQHYIYFCISNVDMDLSDCGLNGRYRIKEMNVDIVPRFHESENPVHPSARLLENHPNPIINVPKSIITREFGAVAGISPTVAISAGKTMEMDSADIVSRFHYNRSKASCGWKIPVPFQVRRQCSGIRGFSFLSKVQFRDVIFDSVEFILEQKLVAPKLFGIFPNPFVDKSKRKISHKVVVECTCSDQIFKEIDQLYRGDMNCKDDQAIRQIGEIQQLDNGTAKISIFVACNN